MDWQGQTFSFNWLRKQANDHSRMTSAVDFLIEVGIIPNRAVLSYKGRVISNRNPVVSLRPEAIKARYLAEVACDWDAEGESSPVDFTNMLAFEVNGTEERETFEELMASLVGSTYMQEESLAA